MKVAVTGVRGLVGSRLLSRLAEAGCHGYGLDVPRPCPAAGEALPSGWEFMGIDLRSGEGLERVPWNTLDAVVHLAAAGVRPDGRNWPDCVDINVGGTLRLLRVLTLQQARPTLIYAGTCYEELVSTHASIREDPYVLTKSLGRQAVELWAVARETSVVILNLFSIFGGAAGGGVLGYARQQFQRGEVASLRAGNGLRDWVYLPDAVDALVRTVTMPHRGVQSYDVGTGSVCSVRDAVVMLAQLMGGGGRVECGTAPVRVTDDVSFRGATRLVPGWYPRFTLRDGLAAWIKEEGGAQ